MPKKVDTASFISNSISMHGDRYDYKKVKYINALSRVTIICPQHGDFLQYPHHHQQGSGCPFCASNKRSSTNEFITKSQKKHGDRYDYSRVKYINNYTRVAIICSKHGEFSQEPRSHLSGNGCTICGYSERSKTKSNPDL